MRKSTKASRFKVCLLSYVERTGDAEYILFKQIASLRDVNNGYCTATYTHTVLVV